MSIVDPAIVTQIAQAAVTAERLTGCPAEVLAAQCALESGWLKNAPQNNCFGYKIYPGCYGKQLCRTTEWFTIKDAQRFAGHEFTPDQFRAGINIDDGRRIMLMPSTAPPRIDGKALYSVIDWFATFPSLASCFAFRAGRWDRGIYAPAAAQFRQDHSIGGYIEGIAKAGYATDPDYVKKLMAMLTSEGLAAAVHDARQAASPVATT